jgi:hypothetical protein
VHHGWTLLVLLIVTAIFVVMSLLPLLDPWYTAFALLTGAQRAGRRWKETSPGVRKAAGRLLVAKQKAVLA